jgi:uncharacterized protein with FMN-binding domain
MKHIVGFFVFNCSIGTLIIGMVLGCLSFNAKTNSYVDGVYEGVGEGYQGPIRIAVRVGPGGILNIEIFEHTEDEFVGEAAMKELLEMVLDSNSTDLDAISGATESSVGFLAAVEDALKKVRE